MLTLSELQLGLKEVEEALLQAYGHPEPIRSLPAVLDRLKATCSDVQLLDAAGALDEATANLAFQMAKRTSIISAGLCGVESDLAGVEQRLELSCVDIMLRDKQLIVDSSSKPSLQPRRMPSRLATSPSAAPQPASTPAASISASATTAAELQLNAVVLRRWFRDNLESPFPSKADKNALVAETNALATGSDAGPSSAACAVSGSGANGKTITYDQVVLWFINARRRSGWTDFFRKFAWSDKSRMAAMMDALAVSASDRPVVDDATPALRLLFAVSKQGKARKKADIEQDIAECQAGFAKLIDWVHQAAREKVGDWLDVVLAEAAAERRAKGIKDPSKPSAASEPVKVEEKPPTAALDASANATRPIAGRKTRRLPKKTCATPSPPADPKAAIGASPTTTSLDGQTKLAFSLPGAAQFSLRVPPPQTSLAGRRDSTSSRTVSGSSTNSVASSVPSLVGGAQGLSIGSSPSDASMSQPSTPLSMPTFQHMILHDSPLRRQQVAQQQQRQSSETLAVYKPEAAPSCSPGSDASSGLSLAELSSFPSNSQESMSIARSSASSEMPSAADASPDYTAFICASATPSPHADKPAAESADDSGFFENEVGMWDPFSLSQHVDDSEQMRAHTAFGSLALHEATSQESVIWRTPEQTHSEHGNQSAPEHERQSPVDEALALLSAPTLSRSVSQTSAMSA